MHHAAIASALLRLASAGLLVSCTGSSMAQDAPPFNVELIDIPVTMNRKVDLLFLIDDSPSMNDKQINLTANFPKFIDVLSTIQGGLPDVHIAVVTSDLGTRQADGMIAPSLGLIGSGGCSGTGKNGTMQLFNAPVTGGPFISDILDPMNTDGSRLRNYTGNLTDVFSTMAKAGAGGCGFEQHLEAMKLALNKNPANAGFLRDDAYLAVVFLADEDDCSMSDTKTLLGPVSAALGPVQSFRCTRFGVLCDDGGTTPNAMNQVGTKGRCHPNDTSPYLTKVSDYVQFLKGLKTDPNNVIVAGIMGTSEPFATELRAPSVSTTAIPALGHSCTYIGGDGRAEIADPPIRLRFFLDQFPNRSTFAPICQQDLSGGFQQISALLKTVIIGAPCIEGTLADVDPELPGPQYACAVSVVTGRGTPAQSETTLPKCTPEDSSATNQPCWHLATDAANCPNSDHITFKIEGQGMLVSDAHVIASCPTELIP